MRLDAWLQEQPLLDERLRFVEQLAIAVDETNRMRQPLGLLEPGRVELTDNLECDLKSARGRVDPTAPYAAPERLEGAPASAESDIYSAGAIAWEVLAGRPCGDPPEHLSTACRDVARELADAIMACLERSPEWRPKDLSYVAELARAGQQTAARTAPRGAARKQAARAAAPSAAAARTAAPRERRAPGPSAPSSRGLYVALAGVLLVGAGGLAFYLLSPFGRDGAGAGSATPAPVRPDSLAASPVATAPAAATATTPPSVAVTAPPPAAAPVSAAPLPTAQAQPTRPPAAPVTTAPVTTPAAAAVRPPVVETRPQQPPATTAAAPPPAAQPQAAPPQSAPPQTEPAQPPPAAPATQPVTPTAAAAARPPATLTAVSPLTARRGGKVLLDLHGTGLHDGLRATIVAIKEAPRGITIMRQKCPSDTLMNVLLDIDANAAPGAYAIVVDDPAGQKTKPLTFTVAR